MSVSRVSGNVNFVALLDWGATNFSVEMVEFFDFHFYSLGTTDIFKRSDTLSYPFNSEYAYLNRRSYRSLDYASTVAYTGSCED